MIKFLSMFSLLLGVSYAIEPNKPDKNLLENNVVKTETESVSGNKTSNEQLFDINKLITTKHFIKMNEDEKDWARLNTYNRLSLASQKFWQKVMAEKYISNNTKFGLYCSQEFRVAVLSGLNPVTVLFDELKFNIDTSCLVGSESYLSPTVLSNLKAEVEKCFNITKKHVLGIKRIQELLNMNNSALAEKIYWAWWHKNKKTNSAWAPSRRDLAKHQ